MNVVTEAKDLFYKKIEEFGSDPYHLKGHVPLVDKQIRNCLIKEPTANELVCLLGGWLHDIGHYPIPTEIDHAVRWEEIARKFLQDNWVEQSVIDQVAHCVRSHRCRDVQPESIEAKIIAFSDSASHMIDTLYLNMAKEGRIKEAFEKLERDYRDLSLLPELKWDFEGIYESWKFLLWNYEKLMSEN